MNGFRSVVAKRPKVEGTKNGELSVVKCSGDLGEMCILSLINSYVAVCRFCAVRCLIIIIIFIIIIIHFPLLFSKYSTCVF